MALGNFIKSQKAPSAPANTSSYLTPRNNIGPAMRRRGIAPGRQALLYRDVLRQAANDPKTAALISGLAMHTGSTELKIHNAELPQQHEQQATHPTHAGFELETPHLDPKHGNALVDAIDAKPPEDQQQAIMELSGQDFDAWMSEAMKRGDQAHLDLVSQASIWRDQAVNTAENEEEQRETTTTTQSTGRQHSHRQHGMLFGMSGPKSPLG